MYTGENSTLQRFFNLFSGLENRIILTKNNIEPSKVTVIRKIEDFRPDDIVIVYNLLDINYRHLDQVHVFKAASLIHFGGQASQYDRIKKAGINCLFCEVNLEHTSELYRRYSNLDLPWIVHPFVFASRFRSTRPFKDRINKAFSTGTITYKYEPEFLNVYGDPCDQPIRKIVRDNPGFFRDTIDSTSQDYIEDNDQKIIESSDNIILKGYKRVYNRMHVGRQKKYFSFDMVEKFNSYKMHVVGEEILGVPGIGFVEGMACGSAYVGLDSPMYRDLGLIPNVHYISYDGTKEGLKATIEYWQKTENQEMLERIAEEGSNFVRTNFAGPRVAERLLKELVQQKNMLYSPSSE